MATEGEKIGRLRDFFLDAFTVAELKMFLTVNGYEAVVATVNQRAGGMEYFFAVAQALKRTGARSMGSSSSDCGRNVPRRRQGSASSSRCGLPRIRRSQSHRAARFHRAQSVAPVGSEPETFDFDVFLSHSSKDKPVVRELAERLRRDRLKVWFDEWETQPGESMYARIRDGLEHMWRASKPTSRGESIYAKVRDGLERSRILLLFMSRNGFGSDWATLEHQIILFTNPLNWKRRLIPLRLDAADIPAMLRPFKYLDWRTPGGDAYQSLLVACRVVAPASEPGSASSLPTPTDSVNQDKSEPQRRPRRERSTVPRLDSVLKGHTGSILRLGISADGCRAVSGSSDKTVRVWDLVPSVCAAVLAGHKGDVNGVAISADGCRTVSGSSDKTVRVWDLDSGACAAVLQGHTEGINSVAVTADGRRAVSGSWDKTVRVWDLDSGACAAVLEGHTGRILSVAVTADGRRAVSGSWDKTVRVWDLDSGARTAVIEGHKDQVWAVAVTADGRRAVSGSEDKTVRVWDLDSGVCAAVLEGHEDSVWGVALTADGRRAVSGSDDDTVRVWDLDSGACAAVLEGHGYSPWGVALTADGCRAVSGSARLDGAGVGSP